MGSSQKYWQYARDCGRWASKTKQEDDRETDEDVARENLYEPERRLQS
jgi:hypothetical protein